MEQRLLHRGPGAWSRRDFLKSVAASAGLAALPGCALAGGKRASGPVRGRIDHVIVLMQENRSFDHYFGWLTGTNERSYLDDQGLRVSTHALRGDYEGCRYADPDHSWEGGRRQLERGFLAGASDRFPLGYYTESDVAFHAALSRRFTLCDNYFASVLGPTYPNRSYMHSAQSGGLKDNSIPTAIGHADGFPWPTIWDRLEEKGISWGYYFVDLPVIALWGRRLAKGAHGIADFYADAAAGTLPSVCFVDPAFTSALHTDEHPAGDIRVGQAFVREVVSAVVGSPLWERAVLFVNYDEWGGFFDSVSNPPRAPDARASRDLAEDFGQLGFRVPCTVVSPFSVGGTLASRRAPAGRFYDHTSILKFIERRFGVRPLTKRDAAAADIGELLDLSAPSSDRAEILEALPRLALADAQCGATQLSNSSAQANDLEWAFQSGFFERMGYRVSPPRLRDVISI